MKMGSGGKHACAHVLVCAHGILVFFLSNDFFPSGFTDYVESVG